MSDQSWPGSPVTFFFSDIEKSTLLWERHGEQMRPVLARHDALLRDVVEGAGGHVVKTTGDGLLAVFETAADALTAALKSQRRLGGEAWSEIAPDVLRVRIGLHSGEAQWRAGDYYGTAVNRAARIMDLGHGGQILLSFATVSSLGVDLPPQTSLRDMGKHPLRGLSGDEQIFQLVAGDLGDDFPPLRSGKTLSGNLPAHVSSFVGRTREMAEVRAALPNTRLLTLTGPGGTGKTRLSMQVASDVQAEYEHGAWLVELAPVTDPDLVESSTATVFGLSSQPDQPVTELLLDYLREKEVLLILDNCEHLITACAQLSAGLIADCPNLTILASSREGLGVYGETTYHLPTLSLPPAAGADLETIGQSEAVRLFVERASAAQPGFRLNEANATAVAQVVRRLDGIPLAIELAAARLKIFTVDQVAARLDDRFRLLTGGSRTALPRQQTLRALIDWSYDLLEKDERFLFRRLSVFVGGWTFDAAESVAFPLDAFTLLPQLLSKSLVMRELEPASELWSNENAPPEPRYFYLETIRQYARDRLIESDEVEEARDRHFAYFDALGESINFGIGPGAEQMRAGRMILEHDNLRSAVEWGIDRYPQRVIKLIWNFSIFLSEQLPGPELIDWISRALRRFDSEQVGSDLTDEQRAQLHYKGLVTLGLLNLFLGQVDKASSIGNDVIEELRHNNIDPLMLGVALFIKGQAGHFLEDPELGETLAEGITALKAIQDHPASQSMLAMALLLTAQYEARQGNPALTEQYYLEATTVLDNAGSVFVPWAEYGRTLMVMTLDSDPDEVRRQYELGLRTLRENGSRRLAAMAESDWGHRQRHEGDFDEATTIYRRMLVEWRELGHRAAMANMLENMAFIARVQDRPQRAAKLLGAAERIREEVKQGMLPPEREEYDREVAALEEALTPQEVEQSWAQGRALSTDALIDMALEKT